MNHDQLILGIPLGAFMSLRPKLVVAVVVVAFDSRFFEGAVHPLYLAIGPWMVGLGQSVVDVVLAADLIEAVNPVMGRNGPIDTALRSGFDCSGRLS